MSGIGKLSGPTPLDAVRTLDMEDLAKELGMAQAWQAMTRALLDGAPGSTHYLRGIARLGIDNPPTEDIGVDLHAHVMRTLERLGLEPLTSAEVDAEMAQATNRMAAIAAATAQVVAPVLEERLREHGDPNAISTAEREAEAAGMSTSEYLASKGKPNRPN